MCFLHACASNSAWKESVLSGVEGEKSQTSRNGGIFDSKILITRDVILLYKDAQLIHLAAIHCTIITHLPLLITEVVTVHSIQIISQNKLSPLSISLSKRCSIASICCSRLLPFMSSWCYACLPVALEL